ncbi:hypothetical protein AB4144_37340, partial [Rhizobiaceae sp. 2RAB30]
MNWRARPDRKKREGASRRGVCRGATPTLAALKFLLCHKLKEEVWNMRFAIAAALVMSFVMPAAGLEGGSMPNDIAEKIRAFGRVINPEEIAAIYAPLQEREPYGDVVVTRDIRYGPDSRNLLDVFSPTTNGRRPALIFVHGGGFTTGNKRIPGSPFYDNVALAAV